MNEENKKALAKRVWVCLNRSHSENMGGSQVKTAICQACHSMKLGLWTYATGTEGDIADGREWLYDVTCLTYDDDKFLSRAVLVAECEWGSEQDICDDSQKLLVANADIRVMVFDGLRWPRLFGQPDGSVAPVGRQVLLTTGTTSTLTPKGPKKQDEEGHKMEGHLTISDCNRLQSLGSASLAG